MKDVYVQCKLGAFTLVTFAVVRVRVWLIEFFPHRLAKNRVIQLDLSLEHVPGAAAVIGGRDWWHCFENQCKHR